MDSDRNLRTSSLQHLEIIEPFTFPAPPEFMHIIILSYKAHGDLGYGLMNVIRFG